MRFLGTRCNNRYQPKLLHQNPATLLFLVWFAFMAGLIFFSV
ncbi:hypothetical protein TR2A62_0735 [Thalassobium sp. R2A62]|nr:hypothetical protein TR2A62_0735 [Thalassobium sp. R2A62]